MRLLLDTHAFLWAVTSPERLAPRARRAIENEVNEVHVSAASVWEIAIKARLGRLEEPGIDDLEHAIPEEIERHAFQPLPVLVRHALRIASLLDVHRDPFDRLLVAQASVEDLVLVTSDAEMRKYPIETLWS